MHLARSCFAVCICVLLATGCAISPEERVAAFDEGVRLYDQGKYEEAYRIFDRLSYADVAAARNAALMLRKGQGVEKDPDAAKRMFQIAAEAGLATAAADLGEMLLLGEGAPPDPKKALPWLQMAALAHHAIAEYHLGTMYETGNGVEKDIALAKKLYAASASSGMAEAAERLKALGGEPPPLRPTTVDTAGPSRESTPGTVPAPPDPVPAQTEPQKPSAADYKDISTPDFSTPEDGQMAPLVLPDIPDPGGAQQPSPPQTGEAASP